MYNDHYFPHRIFSHHSQVLVNEEIGYWLARILYAHNPARSDSAKIAGVMELFRVQVRDVWLSVVHWCSVSVL